MKKAIVIGTGVGGAAVSALLSQNGFSVTVFERSGVEGGKAASYEPIVETKGVSDATPTRHNI